MSAKRNFQQFSNFAQQSSEENLSALGYENFFKRSDPKSSSSSRSNSVSSASLGQRISDMASLSDGSEVNIGIGGNPATIITDILDAYNAGLIEELKDFLMQTASPFCEVHFSALQQLFVGQAALCSLWTSLFVAFPNGVFRTAESTTTLGKSRTTFRFYGTKIFPLVIDDVPIKLRPPQTHQTGPAPEDVLRSLSLVADLSRPIYDTTQLLTTATLPEMVFEGHIDLVLDDEEQIKVFEFSWTRVV
jgi:hypothetical protein